MAFHLYSTADAAPELSPLYQSYCAPCTDHLQGMVDDEGAPSYTGHTILGYCSPSETPKTPTYLARVYKEESSDHFVLTSPEEIAAVQELGYVLEGGCWVP